MGRRLQARLDEAEMRAALSTKLGADAKKKLAVVWVAVGYSFPAPDINEMLSEVESDVSNQPLPRNRP
jgi:hypothetical protein